MTSGKRNTFTGVRIFKMHKQAVEFLKAQRGKPEDLEMAAMQRHALELVSNYLSNPTTDWYTTPISRAVTRCVLKTGSVNSAAAELQMTPITAYRHLKQVEPKIPYKIGVNTLQKIQDGLMRQAMYEFTEASGAEVPDLICLSARWLVAQEMRKLDDDMKYISQDVDIRACEKELRWLRSVNLTIMWDKLAEVDVLKMRRLMDIVKSVDSKDRDVRIIIQQYLDAREDTTFETLDRLNDASLYL